MRAIALTLIVAGAAAGQQFEQVSLGPAQHANATKPAFHGDAVSLSALNSTLRQLIQRAYGVEDYQISGTRRWMQKEKIRSDR